jgi:glycerophosphoryl diester phosphodiesterase
LPKVRQKIGGSMAFLEGTPPRIIAHRGLALHHGENTLGAFEAALASGADILETDVHLSSDSQVIIAHDAHLSRVAGRSGLISDFTAAELARMDLGYGEGFPTLEEALRTFPQARFNIDLKVGSVVEPFVELVRQSESLDRVLVASFDEEIRQRTVALLPGVSSSATATHVVRGRIVSWLGLPLEAWSLPPEIVALQIPPSRYGLALVTPSMLRLARRKGLETHVWTINNPTDMKRLWSMGVEGITTDRTDLAHQVRLDVGL